MREAAPALVDLIASRPYADIDSVHQDPVDPMPGWDASHFLHSLPDAVCGRGVAYSLFVVGSYPPHLQVAVAATGNAVIASMMLWSTGGTQINFQGAATDPESVRRAWPEDVAERLLAVNLQWDSGNRFHFPYSLVGKFYG